MDIFDEAYAGTPKWDIARPQWEIRRLAEKGAFDGRILDVGCGTGENAIFLSSQGFDVLGIDPSLRAIEKAKKKAEDRNVQVRFDLGSGLQMDHLKGQFDTVIDSGVFHIFSDEERALFVKNIRDVLVVDGKYHMICFSEHEPTDWGGPSRVSQHEIRATFKKGWKVEEIRDSIFETLIHPSGGRAWYACILLR